MEAFLAYTILGLALGAAYAVAAAGLVVTYTTSGIFNFAHGAMAMAAAYLYWQLRWDDGWGGRWPAPVALFVVVFVAGPLFGVLVDKVVMRNLADTSTTTRIVIPIALLLALTGVVTWVWGSPEPRNIGQFFGSTNQVAEDLPVSVLWHDVSVLVTAAVLAGALYAVLFRTRVGMAMRAVVDSRSLARLNGILPERASAVSWALGTSIAALAGVLLAPGLGALNPLTLTLFVANVFAAAVFGRLRSLPLTFAGAVLLGLAVNYWTWFRSEVGADWDFLRNVRPIVPMILLIAFLLILPQERLRGATVERTRERFSVPTVRQAVIWGAVMVAVVWAVAGLMEAAPQVLLGRGLAIAIIGLSVVLLTGYAGELNLAPMAFAGIGAIVVFQVDVGPEGRALDESASLLAFGTAALVCAVVGALVALPALRLRGLYLALATYAFGVAVTNLVFRQINPLALNIPFVGDGEDVEINLFSAGTLIVPRPHWLGVDLDRAADLRQTAWLVFLALTFVVLGVGLVALRRSSYGLKLTALKDSPAAAATLGMNLVRMKASVFALSAAIAGVGGALFAAHQGSVREADFDIFISLALFLLVTVGGVGYVSGGLIGALLYGAGFAVIGDFWTKLATDYPSFSGFFDFWADFFLFVGPAMAGIALGRNPSGIASQLFEGYGPLRERRCWPYVAGAVALLVGLYVAAFTDVIGNWTWTLATLVVLLALPKVAYTRHPELDPTRPEESPLDTSLDLDRVLSDEEAERLDRALGIAPVKVP